jgi:hypothetical protein
MARGQETEPPHTELAPLDAITESIFGAASNEEWRLTTLLAHPHRLCPSGALARAPSTDRKPVTLSQEEEGDRGGPLGA